MIHTKNNVKFRSLILWSICINYISYSLHIQFSSFTNSIRRNNLSIHQMKSDDNNANTSGSSSGLIIPGEKDDGDDLPEDAVCRAPDPLPRVSSSINFAEVEVNIKYDLWVVGSGTLGEYILKQWKSKYPLSNIIAETKSNSRHDSIKSIGETVMTRLREDRNDLDYRSAKNVIICLPPSSAEEYSDEVHAATTLWAGRSSGGNLVFTSSLGVYGESNGNIVTESFRIDTRSKISTKLLAAEESILLRDGNVIRLAGLYTENRGPHSYWFKQTATGTIIDTNSNGLVNLLHYEDAAAATVALAESTGFSQKIFVACDNEVLTKQQICEAALASKLFPDATMPQFKSSIGPIGKTCDSSLSRRLLNWQPQHTSFRVFMKRLGGEVVEDVRKDNDGTTNGNVSKSEEPVLKLWIPGDDDDF